MIEEEAKEIIKNLFLMPTDWKIRKSYKGKLDFIGAIEGNEALELILNLIQKQDTEINKLNTALEACEKNLIEERTERIKLNNVIDRMSTRMSALCTGLSIVREQFEKQYCEFMNSEEDCCWKTDKECKDCIKEYFMKERRGEYE